jgi:hypothetical protein
VLRAVAAKTCLMYSGMSTLLLGFPSPSANHSICGRLVFSFRIAVAGPTDSACCPITLRSVCCLPMFFGGNVNAETPEKAPLKLLHTLQIHTFEQCF